MLALESAIDYIASVLPLAQAGGTVNRYWPELHAILSVVILATVAGCARSDNNPTGSGNGAPTVSGKTFVVGSTDPLPGVIVKCAGLSVTSADDGSYELRGVPAGTQTITAEKAEYDTYTQTIDVKADEQLYIYLHLPPSRLWGIVANAVDGPIQGAAVRLDSLTVYTDASGRYEFTQLRRRTLSLSVKHPFYLSFDTTLSLSSTDKQADVTLKKEVSYEGTVDQDTYVDQRTPSTSYWNSSTLVVSATQSTYITFSFPSLLSNPLVSIVDANLQLFRNDQGLSLSLDIYEVTSQWTQKTLTFNTQPSQGVNVYSTTLVAGAKYNSVLGLEGFNQLLQDWRGKQPFFGIVIRGSGTTTAGFYSMETITVLKPKLTFKIRY